MALEREAKFSVAPDFDLPAALARADLGSLGLEPSSSEVLDAIYFDTATLDLLRSGVTLRYRATPGEVSGEWTVKLPSRDRSRADAGLLVRTEFNAPGLPGPPPKRHRALVTPRIGTDPLVKVAWLRSTRTKRTIRDGDAVVGEMDDDLVEVLGLDGSGVQRTFREIEVELTEQASGESLDSLAVILERSGASRADQRAKVERALSEGAGALQASRVGAPPPGSLEQLVAEFGTAQIDLLLDDSPTAVRAFRAAAADVQCVIESLRVVGVVSEALDAATRVLDRLHTTATKVVVADLAVRLDAAGVEPSAGTGEAVDRRERKRRRSNLTHADERDRRLSKLRRSLAEPDAIELADLLRSLPATLGLDTPGVV